MDGGGVNLDEAGALQTWNAALPHCRRRRLVLIK
jgi:hypothetical protein